MVDHVGGWDGKSKYITGSNLWRWLKKNNFPPGFRLLCSRCNALDGMIRKDPLLGISGIDELDKLIKKWRN
jgi:hypothetical protein